MNNDHLSDSDNMNDPATHRPHNGLEGQLLLAMPGMEDQRFRRSVILLCEHSDDGAMGIVINKPINDIDLSQVLDQLDLDIPPPTPGMKLPEVFLGGPVNPSRGFVLHSSDVSVASSVPVTDQIRLSSDMDIMQKIAENTGPDRQIVALGYAGWEPEQLMAEIKENVWITAPADLDIIFADDSFDKWEMAIKRMGIDPARLAMQGGTA